MNNIKMIRDIKKHTDDIVNINTEISEVKKKHTDDMNEVNSQLDNKASKDDVARISSGTPLFVSSVTGMSDITKNYVNTTDGFLYVYSNGAWTKTSVQYQSTGIADGSVTPTKTTFLNEIFLPNTSLLDKSNIKEGGIFNPTTGEWQPREDFFTFNESVRVSNSKYTTNAYSVYCYDINGVYIDQFYVTNNSFTITNNNVKRIRPNFKYAITTIANAYLQGDKLNFSLSNEIKLKKSNIIDFVEVQTVKKNTKYMHISSDDFINTFKDITQNSSYKSIFDNNLFAFLKNLHDNYGMVFSGYCFYENDDATFNLSQCTNKFANEFKANSNWLKFGFHARQNSYNYANTSSEVAKKDYEDVITELYRITGSFECIDRVPRLHNYAGNINSVTQWIETTKGSILGLVTSEDSRLCYYHTEKQRLYLLNHDRLNDSTNNITFFSTDLRLESIPQITNELNNRLNNIDYSSKLNDLIIFTHETLINNADIRSKIVECCEFAKLNNYSFDFPMNRLL